MDGFTYYNIFDTKGIEYLFIIAFLILLIPFWIIINKDKQSYKTNTANHRSSDSQYFTNSARVVLQ